MNSAIAILLLHGLLMTNFAVKTHCNKLVSDNNDRFLNEDDGIPNVLQLSYSDVTDPITEMDLPLFWHIPKTGGTTVHDILGECLELVIASQVGVKVDHSQEKTLALVDYDGFTFVNVDTTTPEGLMKAKELGLVQSGLADVAFTSFLYEASQLFDTVYQGRIFGLFRHPVHRAVSMFYYLQIADWEETYDPELSTMTIEEYAASPKVERDWMVRMLTNKYYEHLDDRDLDTAKEIVRQKFLIGLLSDIDTSIERFLNYYGWAVQSPDQDECMQHYLTHGGNAHSHTKLQEGTEAWNALVGANYFDVQLYEYVVQLFQEQKVFFV